MTWFLVAWFVAGFVLAWLVGTAIAVVNEEDSGDDA